MSASVSPLSASVRGRVVDDMPSRRPRMGMRQKLAQFMRAVMCHRLWQATGRWQEQGWHVGPTSKCAPSTGATGASACLTRPLVWPHASTPSSSSTHTALTDFLAPVKLQDTAQHSTPRHGTAGHGEGRAAERTHDAHVEGARGDTWRMFRRAIASRRPAAAVQSTEHGRTGIASGNEKYLGPWMAI